MVSGQSCGNLNQTTKEGGAVTGSRSVKKLCTNVHACYLSLRTPMAQISPKSSTTRLYGNRIFAPLFNICTVLDRIFALI